MSEKKQGKSTVAEGDLKGLIKAYIDSGVSRRRFLTALTNIGLSVAAANALAADFAPFVTRPGEDAQASLPDWVKRERGTGGRLLIAQLKAAGHRYLFVNPSSGETPVYDAMVDEPDMHFIKAVHEGTLVAMADGYARASGEMPFVMFARPGLPNAMTQMFNAWKDRIPMLVMVDDVSLSELGQDGFEALDDVTSMTAPMVKWRWQVETTAKIPEVVRRATKFASTHPRAPVFLAVPEDLLEHEATAPVMDQRKFAPAMKLRPDDDAIAEAARAVAAADNPLIFAGDELRYCHAEAELLEFAELLGIPVVRDIITSWSKPFPTRHPLHLGLYLPTSRFPGKVDVMINLGSRMPYFGGSTLFIEPQVRLIQIRLDPENLARVYPADPGIVADLKAALSALIEEIRRQTSPRKLKRLAAARLERAKAYQAERDEALRAIARERWANTPISGERLAMELEAELDRDTVIVSENDTYRQTFQNYLSYGSDAKDYFENGGAALGWGLGAAFGVKLAMPDRPVTAVVTDGGVLFSGPQALWSYARHQAPVSVVVVNNRSYNNERNRILSRRGRSYETGRDMVCYLGDPDVDYAKSAMSFGVEAEVVGDPDALKPALQRAARATRGGRPYLLDVRVERTGSLATSTWHPELHLSALRSRGV